MEVEDRKFSQLVLKKRANEAVEVDPCLRLNADLGNQVGRP